MPLRKFHCCANPGRAKWRAPHYLLSSATRRMGKLNRQSLPENIGNNLGFRCLLLRQALFHKEDLKLKIIRAISSE